MVHYTFPARQVGKKKYPPVKLHWYDGGLLPERPEELELDRRLPESGTIFVGEEGQADVRDVLGEPAPHSREPRCRPTSGRRRRSAHRGQPRAELDRGIQGKTKCTSPFDYSGPFTETVCLGNVGAMFPGQKLLWDGKALKFTNSEDANKAIQHNYRAGWSL